MTTGSGPAMDAQLELLDRQIVDVDGRMVGKVDDVELAQRPDGRLVVTALLTGPGALGPRLGGALGAIVRSSWSRLSGSPSDRPGRIDIALVVEVGTAVRLGVSRREVNVDGFESWVRDHVVSALPGADGGAE